MRRSAIKFDSCAKGTVGAAFSLSPRKPTSTVKATAAVPPPTQQPPRTISTSIGGSGAASTSSSSEYYSMINTDNTLPSRKESNKKLSTAAAAQRAHTNSNSKIIADTPQGTETSGIAVRDRWFEELHDVSSHLQKELHEWRQQRQQSNNLVSEMPKLSHSLAHQVDLFFRVYNPAWYRNPHDDGGIDHLATAIKNDDDKRTTLERLLRRILHKVEREQMLRSGTPLDVMSAHMPQDVKRVLLEEYEATVNQTPEITHHLHRKRTEGKMHFLYSLLNHWKPNDAVFYLRRDSRRAWVIQEFEGRAYIYRRLLRKLKGRAEAAVVNRMPPRYRLPLSDAAIFSPLTKGELVARQLFVTLVDAGLKDDYTFLDRRYLGQGVSRAECAFPGEVANLDVFGRAERVVFLAIEQLHKFHKVDRRAIPRSHFSSAGGGSPAVVTPTELAVDVFIQRGITDPGQLRPQVEMVLSVYESIVASTDYKRKADALHRAQRAMTASARSAHQSTFTTSQQNHHPSLLAYSTTTEASNAEAAYTTSDPLKDESLWAYEYHPSGAGKFLEEGRQEY